MLKNLKGKVKYFYEEIKSGDITLKMQRKSKMNLSGN